ncbi:unnamed protein product, partial [Iphiclides podalirius]
MGRPVMGRPVMGRPVMGRPVMGRPVMGRPVMGRPVRHSQQPGARSVPNANGQCSQMCGTPNAMGHIKPLEFDSSTSSAFDASKVYRTTECSY